MQIPTLINAKIYLGKEYIGFFDLVNLSLVNEGHDPIELPSWAPSFPSSLHGSLFIDCEVLNGCLDLWD